MKPAQIFQRFQRFVFFLLSKRLTAWARCDKETGCIHVDSSKQWLILHKSQAPVITSKLLYQEEKKCNQTIKNMIPEDYFSPGIRANRFSNRNDAWCKCSVYRKPPDNCDMREHKDEHLIVVGVLLWGFLDS